MRKTIRAAATAIGVAILVALPGAASATEACTFRSSIADLSRYVLDHRTILPKLPARRVGSTAAFLAIRYGDLAPTDARALIAPLVEANAMRADALSVAHSLAIDGLEATETRFGADFASIKSGRLETTTTLRALVLADGGERLLGIIAGANEKEAHWLQLRTLVALADQSDGFKAALGNAAEKKGVLLLAGLLALTASDPAVYRLFAEVHAKDGAKAIETISESWYWLPAIAGNPPLPRSQPGDEALRAAAHRIMIAALAAGEAEYLNLYLNFTGDTALVGAAVDAQLAAISDGKLDAIGRPDVAWIAAYRGMRAAASDPSLLETTLGSITFTVDRHYQGPVRRVLDWAIAAEAIAPYVADVSVTTAPSPPEDLSDEFKARWPDWIAVANLLRDRATAVKLPTGDDDATIAAEQLFAASRHEDLVKALIQTDATPAIVRLADDFARRLDRVCDRYLVQRGEAVLNLGEPIYAFD